MKTKLFTAIISALLLSAGMLSSCSDSPADKATVQTPEQSVEEEIKYYLDELFSGQGEPYFLFDCMISENAPVGLSYGNPYKRKTIN